MANVRAAVSAVVMPAAADRHQERRRLLVGDGPVGDAGDEVLDLPFRQLAAVALLDDGSYDEAHFFSPLSSSDFRTFPRHSFAAARTFASSSVRTRLPSQRTFPSTTVSETSPAREA